MDKVNFSLIVPLLNEEDNVKRLLETLKSSLETNEYINDYEIICINDGSTDNTLARLEEYKDKKTSVYTFTKRNGQTAGIAAGIKFAKYPILGIIDADLQTDPEDFKKMIPKLNEGYDCVNGARFERKDPLIRKISTSLARKYRQRKLKDKFYDITCPIKVVKSECLKDLTFYDTFHRFIPFLVQMQGYKVAEMGVNHRPRVAGKSKYGVFNRLWVGIRSAKAIKWLADNQLHYEIKDSK